MTTATDRISIGRKAYLNWQTRTRLAEQRAADAGRASEVMQTWAEGCLAEERRVRARCEYLYGLAASLGATAEQLNGPFLKNPR